MRETSDDKQGYPCRCAIVLAAGEGKRLQSFVRRLYGYSLPKQYINFIGARSMLELTFDRAEKLVPRERIFTVVARHHLRFAEIRKQLSTRPRECVVVQPQNRETGPGLLLPLTSLYHRYRDASVVVFPSDHWILEEEIFIAHVELAFRAAEVDPTRIILLGLEPKRPQPDYGYIAVGEEVEGLKGLGIRSVGQFIEKPEPELARKLSLNGHLWNSMVMVAKVKTLLNAFATITPPLWRSFQDIRRSLGTARERRVIDATYKKIKSANFSTALLQGISNENPSALGVLTVKNVHWSDWGAGERIMNSIKQIQSLREGNGTAYRGLFDALGKGKKSITKGTGLFRSKNAPVAGHVMSDPFEPDMLLPIQYEDMTRNNSRLDPERRLMLAILKDAIECYQRYYFAKRSRLRRLFCDAEAWILDQDGDWLFSFESICSLLRLDADYLRRGLFQWTQRILERPPTMIPAKSVDFLNPISIKHCVEKKRERARRVS